MRSFFAVSLALITVSAAVDAAPIKWDESVGGNGHYYELILATLDWDEARDAAAASSFRGSAGYLATVTSAEEQQFLSTFVNPDATDAWLGGSDAASEGDWLWVTGPEAGDPIAYTNWQSSPPQPDNCCDGEFGVFSENYLMGWWDEFGTLPGADTWNDLPINPADLIADYTSGYIVEYSVNPIPLPAGFPLLLVGVSLLAVLRRRS